MAKYEDYLPGGSKYTGSEEAGVEGEIQESSQQQEVRQTTTPDTDWEKRYKDLEVAYSRQGQQIGDYRQLVDNYITSTPDDSQDSQEATPITPEEIYENPDEAVRRAVNSHPAIKRAEELEKELAEQRAEAARAEFASRHPESDKVIHDPSFANWVKANNMRLELAQRADQYDLTAADALFSLWEAEQAVTQRTQQNETELAVASIGLENGSGAEAPAPERYSRSAMLQQKIRAKQGDLEAEAYVKAHARAYREALAQGIVRD